MMQPEAVASLDEVTSSFLVASTARGMSRGGGSGNGSTGGLPFMTGTVISSDSSTLISGVDRLDDKVRVRTLNDSVVASATGRGFGDVGL